MTTQGFEDSYSIFLNSPTFKLRITPNFSLVAIKSNKVNKVRPSKYVFEIAFLPFKYGSNKFQSELKESLCDS